MRVDTPSHSKRSPGEAIPTPRMRIQSTRNFRCVAAVMQVWMMSPIRGRKVSSLPTAKDHWVAGGSGTTKGSHPPDQCRAARLIVLLAPRSCPGNSAFPVSWLGLDLSRWSARPSGDRSTSRDFTHQMPCRSQREPLPQRVHGRIRRETRRWPRSAML